MLRGEGRVALGVPVLRQHHMGVVLRQAVDDGHHVIATGNCQAAAGAEIVLNINDQKNGGGVHVTGSR